MDNVCPLCRSGRLTSSPRTLEMGERTFDVAAHQCSTCRETLLAPTALDELKRRIRDSGLAASDSEIDGIVERLLLRAD